MAVMLVTVFSFFMVTVVAQEIPETNISMYNLSWSNCSSPEMADELYDIAFVGTYSVDVALNGFAGAPSPTELTFLSDCKITTGGGACNAAIAAARMGDGIKTLAVGVIGEDEQANIILKKLKEENVDTAGLIQNKNTGTGTTILFIPSNGKTLGVTFVGGNGTVSFSPKVMEKLLQSKVVVISELFLLPNMEKDMKEMLSILKIMKKTIVVDTSANVRNFAIEDTINLLSGVAPFIDYFIPNSFEAEVITGEKDIEIQSQKLENLGFRNVIIKNGSEGALVKQTGKEPKIIPAIKTICVDSAGAGDAFVGGFSYGLAKGKSVEDAVLLGNVLGCLCVGQIGASTGISKEKADNIFSKLGLNFNSNARYGIQFSPEFQLEERLS